MVQTPACVAAVLRVEFFTVAAKREGDVVVIRIVVDDEQAKVIAQSTDVVEIRNREGRILGYVTHGFTADDVALAQQRLRSEEPRFTTQEVLGRLCTAEQQ